MAYVAAEIDVLVRTSVGEEIQVALQMTWAVNNEERAIIEQVDGVGEMEFASPLAGVNLRGGGFGRGTVDLG